MSMANSLAHLAKPRWWEAALWLLLLALPWLMPTHALLISEVSCACSSVISVR